MIQRILLGLAVIFLPLLLLRLIFSETKKAALVFFLSVVVAFAAKYKLGLPLSSQHYYAALVMVSAVTVCCKLSGSSKDAKAKLTKNLTSIKIIKKAKIYIQDILLIFSLTVASIYITITQNRDFYTFYIRPVYNPLFTDILPLFNNIMMMELSLMKDLGVHPCAIAISFVIIFYLLIREMMDGPAAAMLLLAPSLLTIIIHENLYLELSSLTILTISLAFIKYDVVSPYTALSLAMLFFTKANFVIIALALSLIVFVNNIRFRKLKSIILQLVSLLIVARSLHSQGVLSASRLRTEARLDRS
jgi:hypothetical protein